MEAELETKVVDRGSKAERPLAKVVDLAAVDRSVGRYELIHRLGHGGMASVYLGRTTGRAGFERLVAVKVIHPHLASEPEFVEMFLDEARIAARIHHPHVVAIHDVGEDDGVFYMVMEYVEGDTLAALLRQLGKADERLPLSAALQVAADACEGLATAHDLLGSDGEPLRLVHRDVSPHNLLVSMDGRVKVVDFGIMKAAGKRSNTLTGQLRGKLAFMSPEQARGKAIDLRTDLFALGLVIWEMCIGPRLFAAGTESETLARVIACDVPDPLEARPDLPEGLAAVLRKALAKSVDERYESAAAMLKDLRALLRELPADVEPRAELAAAMERHVTGRIEYVRAAVRRSAASVPRVVRPSDSELMASSVDTAPGTEPRASSSATDGADEDTPPLGVAGAAASRSIASAGDTDVLLAPPRAVTRTTTLTTSLAGAPARHWSLWLLLPLVGAAIGTAVATWDAGEPVAIPSPRPAPAAERVAPASTVAPDPGRVAPPPSAADAQPATIKWNFNTEPQGAFVTIDGELYPRPTPLSVELPRSDETRHVVIEKDGYAAREVTLAPTRTENHTYRLQPVAEPIPSERTRTKVRHIRPTLKTRFAPDSKAGPDSKSPSGPDAETPDGPVFKDMPDFRGSRGDVSAGAP